jgi:hypothetical protein
VIGVGGVLAADSRGTAGPDPTTLQDESVNVRDHDAAGDGVTDDTDALQSAVDAAAAGPGQVFVPPGNYRISRPVTLSSGLSVRGVGSALSIVASTHDGAAFTTSAPGERSYTWNVSGINLIGPGSPGSIGLDLDSVSTSHVHELTISGFDKGVRIRSTTDGGAVYNRLTNVTAHQCAAGFSVEAVGSNANTFDRCRVNNCATYGVFIADSNNTSLVVCQIEGCGTGIYMTATKNAMSDGTVALCCRFENNETAWETANSFVRDTAVIYPAIFSPYAVMDSGTRTQHWGAGAQTTQKLQSQFQSEAGSWRFERIVDVGGQFPALVVSDSAQGAGSPVTVQAETEQPGGYPFRAVRSGVTYWDVDASGNMRLPGAGYVELSERENDPQAPIVGTARVYLRGNGPGKAQLCVRFASGPAQVLATEP